MAEARHLRSAALTVILTFSHVNTAKGKVDDCRVLLLHKVVLGETLDVKDEILWQSLKLMAFERRSKFLGLPAVELCEDRSKRDLRNDLLLVQILEQGHRRKVKGEEQERGDESVDVSTDIEGRTGAVLVDDDLLGVDANLALEGLGDDTCKSEPFWSSASNSLELRFLEPPRSRCKVLRIQPRNSTGSP